MKTAYNTFTAWNGRAMDAEVDGGANRDRRTVEPRLPGEEACAPDEGKVIDLNAWRAANLDKIQAEPEEPDWEDEEPVWTGPRPRRDHRRAMLTCELAATLSVAAAAVALIVRVLAF